MFTFIYLKTSATSNVQFLNGSCFFISSKRIFNYAKVVCSCVAMTVFYMPFFSLSMRFHEVLSFSIKGGTMKKSEKSEKNIDNNTPINCRNCPCYIRNDNGTKYATPSYSNCPITKKLNRYMQKLKNGEKGEFINTLTRLLNLNTNSKSTTYKYLNGILNFYNKFSDDTSLNLVASLIHCPVKEIMCQNKKHPSVNVSIPNMYDFAIPSRFYNSIYNDNKIETQIIQTYLKNIFEEIEQNIDSKDKLSLCVYDYDDIIQKLPTISKRKINDNLAESMDTFEEFLKDYILKWFHLNFGYPDTDEKYLLKR